jgi:3-oxoadipate enol-lactonase
MPHAKLNGVKIWFRIMGKGIPILLHPGYTGTKENLMSLGKILKKKFKVIFMESRGTGSSQHTASGYSLRQYADDVIALIDYLKIPKIHFLGHSMGGGIGYLLGLEKQVRIESLILLAPIPSTGYKQNHLEKKLKKIYWEKGYIESMSLLLQNRPFLREMDTKEWFDNRAKTICSVSRGHLIESLKSMENFNIRKSLHNIQASTFIIAGAKDNLLKENLKDYFLLPNATIHVFAYSGHDIARHEPLAIANLINVFLEKRYSDSINSNKGEN